MTFCEAPPHFTPATPQPPPPPMQISWCHHCFPPFAMIPQVLVKLRSSLGTVFILIAPFWPQGSGFQIFSIFFWSPLCLFQTDGICCANRMFGDSTETSPCFGFMPSDYQQFASASSFSAKVAGRLGCSGRPSSVGNYQLKWSVVSSLVWGHSSLCF